MKNEIIIKASEESQKDFVLNLNMNKKPREPYYERLSKK